MRITFVVPLLEVSGGARIVAGHAEQLAAQGHDVLIVAPRPGRAGFRRTLKRLLRLEAATNPRRHALVAKVHAPLHVPRHHGPIVERDVPDADVIIATWWETTEWISGFSARKGAKVHFIQHYEAFPEMPVERVKAAWRLPFFKITIAQWLVDLGCEQFGIEEMALVPNSVDHALFDGLPRGKGEPPTVGFLFHMAPFKNVATSIKAVARVKKALPNVRLVSFGVVMPAPEELPEGCEFHYLPSQEQIARIYARCDAWLSTSRTEGFNLPPLEAMASGCPAVCSKTGRPLEIIEEGVNGYLVDTDNVEGFASAILKILSLADAEWRNMSDAARHSVAHPTWDESSALFEQALMRAVSLYDAEDSAPGTFLVSTDPVGGR
jgi:glycosyltransferase involved in cell wall biosynthesis